jgi:hypothetical protein
MPAAIGGSANIKINPLIGKDFFLVNPERGDIGRKE